MEQEKTPGSSGPTFDTPGPSREPIRASRLYRSKHDRVVAGVCGGLGHYFNIDPILIRIGFVALTIAGGAGVIIYILAAIILPEAKPEEDVARKDVTSVSQGRLLFGGLLILIGGFLLVREFVPWFSNQIIWATILIALGLAIVFKGTQR